MTPSILKAMESEIRAWRDNLLDFSKRSNLIQCRGRNREPLWLRHPAPTEIWSKLLNQELLELPKKRWLIPPVEQDPPAGQQDDKRRKEIPREPTLDECLASPKLKSNHLLTDLADDALWSQLSKLRKETNEAEAERGIWTLHLTWGLLEWFESDSSSVKISSPLLMLPIQLREERSRSVWTLGWNDDQGGPILNASLRELLKRHWRIALPEEWNENDLGPDTLAEIREQVAAQPRWRVTGEMGMANFKFRSFAMYRDYELNWASIASHPICQRLAGHAVDLKKLPASFPQADQRGAKLDDAPETRPAELHTILDCDSSQLEAILAAKAGVDLVLDGPPGTGKSQTIANLIAELLANQKTVLFVSEKAAALDAVRKRLEDCGLDGFVLDCHASSEQRTGSLKEQIAKQLHDRLEVTPDTAPMDSDKLGRLEARRQKLNDYVRELHRPRGAQEKSVFEIQQCHANMPRREDRSRWKPSGDIHDISPAMLDEMVSMLAGLSDNPVWQEQAAHPWWQCKVTESSPDTREWPQDLHDFEKLLANYAERLQRYCDLGLLDPRDSLAKLIDRRKILSNWLRNDPPWETMEDDPQRALERLKEAESIAAKRLKETESIAEEYQQLHSEIDNVIKDRNFPFDETVLNSDWCKKAESGLGSKNANFWQQLADRPATLCEARDQLRKLISSISGMHESGQNLQSELEGICTYLRCGEPAWEQIEDLQRIANIAKPIGEFRPSWFQSFHDQQLRTIIPMCVQTEIEVSLIEVHLSTRLKVWDSRAEELLSAYLSRHALPWYKRLISRFTNPGLDRRIAELYRSGIIPDVESLQRDWQLMQSLAGYKQTLESYARCYEDHFPLGGKSETRWRAVERGRDAVVRLMQVPFFHQHHTALSDTLCTLCTPVDARRLKFESHESAMGQERQAFVLRLEEFHRTQPTLAHAWAPRPMPNTLLSKCLPDLPKKRDSLKRFYECWRPLWEHLRPGADERLDNLPRRLEEIRQLVAWKSRADSLDADLKSRQPAVAEQNSLDALRLQIGHVQRLLSACPQGLSDRPRQLLADARVRSDAAQELESIAGTENRVLKQCAWLASLFPWYEDLGQGTVPANLAISQLRAWISNLREDCRQLEDWFRYHQQRKMLQSLGLDTIARELDDESYSLAEASDVFLQRYYELWLHKAIEDSPVLNDFQSTSHERSIKEFADLDKSVIEEGRRRLRKRILARGPLSAVGSFSANHYVSGLNRWLNKTRRPSLRKLFSEEAQVLLGVKPCWMMSPLSVSTYLDSKAFRFDVVIFDEASQVLPWDAIGAIYRGKQVIVAGDEKQMPPSSFFQRGTNEEEDDDNEQHSDMSQYESILTCLMPHLARKQLRWHYRSRREALIAFSNHYFYDGRLYTFPSPEDLKSALPAVRLDFVASGLWSAHDGYNLDVARRTAELVVEHFESYPQSTLGVISFNEKHQFAIEDQLSKLRKTRPELDHHFLEENREAFFVKNLENVQGDERDRIILSIAYGRAKESADVHKRFGPLNLRGGERRLNVAVTRARDAVTVVSSIRGEDIPLSGTESEGTRLLREYLNYAESGSQVLKSAVKQGRNDYDSPFEMAVANALRDKLEWTVHSQVGCAQYSIDLAVVDPERMGRYLLGIECDGRTYHSSATARDRDRLRQEVLESLGWTIVRVWSTDWFRDSRRQVDRVQAAYERALDLSRRKAAESRLAISLNASVASVSESKKPRGKDAAQSISGPMDSGFRIENLARESSEDRRLANLNKTREEQDRRAPATSLPSIPSFARERGESNPEPRPAPPTEESHEVITIRQDEDHEVVSDPANRSVPNSPPGTEKHDLPASVATSAQPVFQSFQFCDLTDLKDRPASPGKTSHEVPCGSSDSGVGSPARNSRAPQRARNPRQIEGSEFRKEILGLCSDKTWDETELEKAVIDALGGSNSSAVWKEETQKYIKGLLKKKLSRDSQGRIFRPK